MKKLKNNITKILTPVLAGTGAPIEVGAPLEAGVIDVIDDVIKAVREYFHEVEEAACYLLEVWPLENNTIAIKSKVTETCTLVYSISKE